MQKNKKREGKHLLNLSDSVKLNMQFAEQYALWHMHIKLQKSSKLYQIFIGTNIPSKSRKKCGVG